MSSKIRVLCVDDSDDISRLLELSVAAEPDMVSVGRLREADGLTGEVARAGADVVIMDLSMPGKEPLFALRELAVASPAVRVVVFSGHDDTETVNQAIEAGAWGFVSKQTEMSGVLEAIRKVASGNVVFPI